ncbi:MAG: iron ABC transporter permease [Roseburia sp.]|nr:iron ABC transporter permease [Roseburia sp.]
MIKTMMKKSHVLRFTVFVTVGAVALVILILLFMMLGAEKVPFAEVWNGLFHFDSDNFHHIIVRNIRLPRLLADIMVGVSLAVAGAVMQGNTQNPMADSGIMGISSGSIFAIILMMAFLPDATRLERIGFSCVGAAGATLLIYAVAMMGRRGITAERMVLSGMAISTLFSSITSAIVLKEGMSSEMMKYTAGSSANTLWLDIRIAAPVFLVGFAASLLISKSLTVMTLGEDVSKGLGTNIRLTKFMSTAVVLVLSAIAVVIIGPVGYVGLMVPHIVRYFVGSDYRLILPSCAVLGAVLVVLVDLLARVIIAPLEFPVGILLTMIGVPFFIFISRKQRNDSFGV